MIMTCFFSPLMKLLALTMTIYWYVCSICRQHEATVCKRRCTRRRTDDWLSDHR